MPTFLTRLLPTFTPIRNKISHIRQYKFAAEFIKGEKVLDAACGTGYGSEILRRNGNHVVGVDINPENIAFAHINFPYNDYKEGNIEDLKTFSTEEFGAVVSIQTIEHLWYPRKAVNEIHRVLKTNGLFIGSIPVNCKHRMPAHAESSDVFLFDDCEKLLTPTFREISWFYHFLQTNAIKKTTKNWLRGVTTHSGDFVFVAKK
jgi:ubiquinone/menaquinone biosynthesis C-methylase UbiE